jgi:SAM-dependent methyltransferase
LNCRHCGTTLHLPFLDLGSAPPSNAYLTEAARHAPEVWFPLRLLVCTQCWLVQTEDYAGRELLFSADYAYFSSFSSSWLAHARAYVLAMRDRFDLGPESLVAEVAANDGYLLQYVREMGIPCFGIEPTHGTAETARAKGIEIVEDFFGTRLGRQLAQEGRQVDLATANNVLAHVPDIGDFVSGFARLLKPQGVATFEFPHLLRMVEDSQFDTAYHEHYSYLSLTAVEQIFAANGLGVFDVEQWPTHGGSLRVFAQRRDTGTQPATDAVRNMLALERETGLCGEPFYADFQGHAEHIKNELLRFLLDARSQKLSVAAYGAAAKGNTLLNFAGVRSDLLPYVVDRNPAKQGKYLPGSRIPIVGEDHLRASRPDLVLLLPWNLQAELVDQLRYIREWNGRFVLAAPRLQVV